MHILTHNLKFCCSFDFLLFILLYIIFFLSLCEMNTLVKQFKLITKNTYVHAHLQHCFSQLLYYYFLISVFHFSIVKSNKIDTSDIGFTFISKDDEKLPLFTLLYCVSGCVYLCAHYFRSFMYKHGTQATNQKPAERFLCSQLGASWEHAVETRSDHHRHHYV